MFELFGEIRFKVMKNLILSCKPEDKVICDLGACNPSISDGIDCKKRIKIDINAKSEPDIVCDLTKGISLSNKSVDICIAGEILEHIYNSKKFISAIKMILKSNGYLILSCPNICSLKYRIAFLLGKIPAHAAKADCQYQDKRAGHVRDYNFEEVEKALKMVDFNIIEKKSDGVSINGKTIIPRYIFPKTFGDSVIIKAKVMK